MAAQPIRVVLVDDHPAIVAAVGDAVRSAPDLVLAGTARSLDEARTPARRHDRRRRPRDRRPARRRGRGPASARRGRARRSGRPAALVVRPAAARAHRVRARGGRLPAQDERGARDPRRHPHRRRRRHGVLGGDAARDPQRAAAALRSRDRGPHAGLRRRLERRDRRRGWASARRRSRATCGACSIATACCPGPSSRCWRCARDGWRRSGRS